MNKRDTAKILLLVYVGLYVLVWVGGYYAQLHADQLRYNGSIMPNGSVDQNWYDYQRVMFGWSLLGIFGGLGIWILVNRIDSDKEYQPEPTKEELEEIVELIASSNVKEESKQ
jgi:hypothetical protein